MKSPTTSALIVPNVRAIHDRTRPRQPVGSKKTGLPVIGIFSSLAVNARCWDRYLDNVALPLCLLRRDLALLGIADLT